METEQELINALDDDSVDVITLKSDIAINDTLTVDRKVALDLYGYMLEMKGSGSVIAIQDGGDLTLEDSDPKALYMFDPDANGLWTWVASGGTKAVRGGVIYGGTGTVMGAFTIGGGVYVYDGGRFTMNGGSIVGCTAAGPVAYGGGVCIYGTFTMNGGNIAGCTAVGDRDSDPKAYGGGVYVTGIGTFAVTGGSIIGCTATSGSGMFANGGGIYNIGDTTLSGTAEIRDCHVKSTVGMYGGGISSGDGPLNISGDVKVSGCTAGGQGSDAALIYRGTISGGTFYGSVTNWGTISDGTFCGSITNYGAITGGMFYGGITNDENRGKIDGLTVTYRVNGADYAVQVLQSGDAVTKPDDPTAEEGYVFAGWFGGNTAYDFTSPVTEDITLTAKWVELKDETADFTAADGGAAAIALLNSAKTGAENSLWDNDTKTLTLNGIYFATTATTAVKLPDGATVILADGTENRIVGGDAAAVQDGKYQKQIYVYGVYAAGALTVQGETNGTGTLFVGSGEHINSGDAWTYSAALYADGSLTVKGGAVTAQGGKTSSADCAFSLGVQLSEGHSLSVMGGTLTGIGGESHDTEDPNDVDESFSEGIDIYRGNVTISGSGRIIAENVSDMADGGLSFGLWISFGNLYVSDSAALTATSYTAIQIDGGDIRLSGGKISAFQTVEYGDAVSVGRNDHYHTGNGNIEITGGELACVGGLRINAPETDGMGILSVTNGKSTAESIYGPNKLIIANSTVTSGRINANTVELQSGSLTVREPVYKSEYIDIFYAASAIYCKGLTISGGTLDAAWDWGEYTPSVLPADSYWGYAQPLIEIRNGTASFSGGTVTLDTGCAGNTAIKAKTLALSSGVRGSGYVNEDGSDTYSQSDGSTPVKFVVYPADYTKVDAAIDKANALNKADYKDFSAVQTAIDAVVRGKNLDEQAAVDAMAKAIEDAIAALAYKDADYTNVDATIKKANTLNKADYKDFSAVQAAIDAVVRGKNTTEQAAVDAMAKAIEDAIAALAYKDADYTNVDAAIKKANTLNKADYKDFSAVEAAIDTVVRGKNITEQAAVDAMAKAIEDAIDALAYKDADYTNVDAAIKKANTLNKADYKDFSAVQAAIDAVVRGKNTTEQAAVDAMAKAIEDAIGALEKKPAEPKPGSDNDPPRTGDSSSLMLWFALLFIGGGACTALTVKRKKATTTRR